MALKSTNSAKSKIDSLISSFKAKGPGSLSAVVLLILTVVVILSLDIVDRLDVPTVPGGESTETAQGQSQGPVSGTADTSPYINLQRVIEASGSTPFKARLITETGLKGFWTQSGDSYRFEDPSRQKVIIFDSSKRLLWSIDASRKIAIETPVDTQTAASYRDLGPLFFIGGLSDTSTAGTKSIDSLLPGGDETSLTFTAQGLPQRWEGVKNGVHAFIFWEYMQVHGVPARSFEVPRGIPVTRGLPDR